MGGVYGCYIGRLRRWDMRGVVKMLLNRGIVVVNGGRMVIGVMDRRWDELWWWLIPYDSDSAVSGIVGRYKRVPVVAIHG